MSHRTCYCRLQFIIIRTFFFIIVVGARRIFFCFLDLGFEEQQPISTIGKVVLPTNIRTSYDLPKNADAAHCGAAYRIMKIILTGHRHSVHEESSRFEKMHWLSLEERSSEAGSVQMDERRMRHGWSLEFVAMLMFRQAMMHRARSTYVQRWHR